MNDTFTRILDEERLPIEFAVQRGPTIDTEILPRLWRFLAQTDQVHRDRLLSELLGLEAECLPPCKQFPSEEVDESRFGDDQFVDGETLIGHSGDGEEALALFKLRTSLLQIEGTFLRGEDVGDRWARPSVASGVMDEFRHAVLEHFHVVKQRSPSLTVSQYLSTPALFTISQQRDVTLGDPKESRLGENSVRSHSGLCAHRTESITDSTVPEFRFGPLGQLPVPMQWALRAQMKAESYRAGEIIVAEAESATCLYVCCSGTANAAVTTATGTQSVIGRIGPGQVIGEMALMGIATRTATVTAEGPCELLRLTKEDFLSLVGEYQELANVVTTIIGERLGNQQTDALSTVTLDGYRISKRLGRGGMSVVYDATHVQTDQRVALKMMSHRLCFDPAVQTSFMREAEIISAFDHPHIPRLLDRFDAFSTSFIAMQYVDGDALSQLIARHGPFPEGAALKVLGALSAALMYAHENGIVHRDVKPSNCMVDQSGHVTLMDFGLSIPFASADNSGSLLVGTPAYMSPEQFRGQVRPESDWFSLGCLGYEMLTGKRLMNPSSLPMMAETFENWDINEIIARLPRHHSLAPIYLRSLLSLTPAVRTTHLPDIKRHRGRLLIANREMGRTDV